MVIIALAIILIVTPTNLKKRGAEIPAGGLIPTSTHTDRGNKEREQKEQEKKAREEEKRKKAESDRIANQPSLVQQLEQIFRPSFAWR
jgi:hypothetical protein